MTRLVRVQHQFVDVVPDTLREGVLYVCVPHTTAVHLCLCGCGEEVVTPIRPTGWRITFDGVAVSLHPSIGNWDFTCRSHYWIIDGQVRWDRRWTHAQVATARRGEDAQRIRHFAHATPTTPQPRSTTDVPVREHSSVLRLPQWLRRLIRRHAGRRHNHDQEPPG